MTKKEDAYQFRGVASPNTTQVPDQYLDELLPILSGAELKVLLYITRRTFGFKKTSDTISLSQLLHGITTKDGRILDRGTGLSKPTLLVALRSLTAKHIIGSQRRHSLERGDEATSYSLCFATAPTEPPNPVVKKVAQGGGQETLPRGWSKKLTTQQTGEQQTELQQTVSSNLSISKRANGDNEPVTGDAAPRDQQQKAMQPQTPNRLPRPVPSERIDVLVTELSHDFEDTQHEQSNRTQALRLLAESGLTEAAFEHRLYEARSIVRDAIHRRRHDEHAKPIKRPMAFFFAVVRDLLKPHADDTTTDAASERRTA